MPMKAQDLKVGNFFSYVGAFATYYVETLPKEDPTYPGKLVFLVSRDEVRLTIRLDADLDVSADAALCWW